MMLYVWGRALETLLPCAEILVVEYHSADATRRIAREYGARIVVAEDGVPQRRYLDLASFDWILCLEPTESITEGLQASLFEWSALPSLSVASGAAGGPAYSVFVREQAGEGWLDWTSVPRKPASYPVAGPYRVDASPPMTPSPSRSKGSCCVSLCADKMLPIVPSDSDFSTLVLPALAAL